MVLEHRTHLLKKMVLNIEIAELMLFEDIMPEFVEEQAIEKQRRPLRVWQPNDSQTIWNTRCIPGTQNGAQKAVNLLQARLAYFDVV
ncbi:MAG: hypothetical protein JSU63_01890 [Phycisphaerales bacterium]|nr:MAG: hypothetical protein JSU63_01890 [Phycisphaerales bacterium]